MKIAIMGFGVVGGSVAAMLGHKVVDADIVAYDPPKGLSPSLQGVDIAFICVPAPTLSDGHVDLEHVRSSLTNLPAGAHAIIRSTVLPGTTEMLQSEFPKLMLWFVPEFLSEKTAVEDTLAPRRPTVIGVAKAQRDNVFKHLQMFQKLFVSTRVQYMEATSAEFVKYAANTFYALKVIFFNELYDVVNAVPDANWNAIRKAICEDDWTGPQHTDPFHGGYRGYGGKCLPKDTKAFIRFAEELGTPMPLLVTAERENNCIYPHKRVPK